MKKRYRVLRTFGLAGQGFFVEGSEVEIEVGEKRPVKSKDPFMTPVRESELLVEERIELVRDDVKEVKHGKIQS